MLRYRRYKISSLSQDFVLFGNGEPEAQTPEVFDEEEKPANFVPVASVWEVARFNAGWASTYGTEVASFPAIPSR